MAKGKPAEALWSSEGTFGAHTRPEGKESAISASVIPADAWVVIKRRPKRHPTPTPAQINQRAAYSECDCLWKNREPEQVEAWNRYIGLTRNKKTKVKDAYRLHMSHCLRWNFLEFFEEYLYSLWIVDSVVDSQTLTSIVVHMGSRFDGPVPLPTWEPETLLQRFI